MKVEHNVEQYNIFQSFRGPPAGSVAGQFIVILISARWPHVNPSGALEQLQPEPV